MSRMSRFPVHDDLTAPEGSLPVLRGALASAGQLPNVIGVLAGSAAALRAYARFRSELRQGSLPAQTLERIAVAVAAHHGSEPGLALHQRTAREAGLRLDEIARARTWQSGDEKEAVLLELLRLAVAERATPPLHLHEEAREAGWTDAQLLEALAFASIEAFTAIVNVAGDVPVDGSVEESRRRHAA
ncbi:MAG: carboxymuconolactone decarboxylase family protein [Solirubrobacterales bacterium]|nr:carboxymuconolactone decarboxylase family protein [Solirubrobacterales bacterium]